MPITYSVNSQATVDALNKAQTVDKLGYQDPSKSDAANEATMNFDMFLKMLTTQLANQDPLNPMDGTAFTEQIATFSSLEQQIAGNESLEKLVANQDFGAQTLAVSYIGKEALAPGDKMTVPAEGKGAEFAYSLNAGGQTSAIEIVNEAGDTVAVMEGPAFAGLNQIVWDGKDVGGEQVPPGQYKAIVKAIDVDGEEMEAKMYSYGHVKAVDVVGDDLTLVLSDGREEDFNSVLSVKEAVNSES